MDAYVLMHDGAHRRSVALLVSYAACTLFAHSLQRLRFAQAALVLSLLGVLVAWWIPPHWRVSVEWPSQLPTDAQTFVNYDAGPIVVDEPAVPSAPVFPWLTFLFFTGALLRASWLLMDGWRLRRIVRAAIPLRAIGNTRLLLTEDLDVPCSLGWGRKAIVLRKLSPARFVTMLGLGGLALAFTAAATSAQVKPPSYVAVESPSRGTSQGGVHAAPIFRKIVGQTLR